jgi:hypothetical protein
MQAPFRVTAAVLEAGRLHFPPLSATRRASTLLALEAGQQVGHLGDAEA